MYILNTSYDQISFQMMIADNLSLNNLFQNLTKHPGISPIIALAISPYMHLIAKSTIDLLKKNDIDIHTLELKQKYWDLISRNRLKIKLYQQKTNQNLKSIQRIHENENKYFRDLLRFNLLKRHGLYYDFGTYSVNSNYIGNTNLFNYYFEGFHVAEKKLDTILLDYSRAIGQLLGVIAQIWPQQKSFYINDNLSEIDIKNKDWNLELRANQLFYNENDLNLNLFLFNLLCLINFVLFILPKLFNQSEGIYYIILYLGFYYISENLGKLRRSYQGQKLEMPLDFSYREKSDKLINKEFCNAMRHYQINAEDLQLCSINYETPLYGLIQANFNITPEQFNEKITGVLYEIRETIENCLF